MQHRSFVEPFNTKVGCVFSMVIIPILPQTEFGPNDHREDAPHFNILFLVMTVVLILILSWFNNKIQDIKSKENTNNKYKRFVLKFQMYFKARSHPIGFKYNYPNMGFYFLSALFDVLVDTVDIKCRDLMDKWRLKCANWWIKTVSRLKRPHLVHLSVQLQVQAYWKLA